MRGSPAQRHRHLAALGIPIVFIFLASPSCEPDFHHPRNDCQESLNSVLPRGWRFVQAVTSFMDLPEVATEANAEFQILSFPILRMFLFLTIACHGLVLRSWNLLPHAVLDDALGRNARRLACWRLDPPER
jgi:hypothetical protein